MKNFKKLLVWQKGIELTKEIYKISKLLPDSEKYGIISQIRRASVSIPSNIAEGSSRNSEKDYRRFLEIALGSAYELETLLIIIAGLEYLNSKETDVILGIIIEVQKMLTSFMNKMNF